MALTEDERRQVLEHLNETWKVPFCRYCGTNDWQVSGTVFLRMSDEGELNLGAPAEPTASVTCQYCGNTVLVNLIVAGVYEPTVEGENDGEAVGEGENDDE